MAKCKGGKCKSSKNCDDCVTKHLTKQFKEKRAKAILKAKYNPAKSYDPFHWARGLPSQQIFQQPKRHDLAFTLQDVENHIEKAFAKRDKPEQIIRVIHEGNSFKEPLAPRQKSASFFDDLPSFDRIISNREIETQTDHPYEEVSNQFGVPQTDQETETEEIHQTDQETQYKPETGEIETQTEEGDPLPPSPEVGSLSLSSPHETSQVSPSFSQSIVEALNDPDVGAETIRMLDYSGYDEAPNDSPLPSGADDSPVQPYGDWFEDDEPPPDDETERLESSYEPNKSQKKKGYYPKLGVGLQFGSPLISPELPRLKLTNVVETPRKEEVEEVRDALERQKGKAKPSISWIGTPLTPPSPELLSQSPEPKDSFQFSSRGAKSGGKPDRLRRTNAQIAADSARLLDGQPVITSRFPTIKNTQLSRVDKDDLESQKTPVAESREFSFI